MTCIQPGSFLTLHYRLAGPEGVDLVNTFGGRPATLTLGSGVLAPALEQRLIGLPEGARQTFALAAGEAFGARNAELQQRVKRSLVREASGAQAGAAAGAGDIVRLPTPDGQDSYSGVVREVGDDWLLIDFNHPLAGHAVQFEVQVLGVLP